MQNEDKRNHTITAAISKHFVQAMTRSSSAQHWTKPTYENSDLIRKWIGAGSDLLLQTRLQGVTVQMGRNGIIFIPVLFTASSPFVVHASEAAKATDTLDYSC